MPEVYGYKYTAAELRKRVGDMRQLAGAQPFRYTDGKADGTAAIEVKTGGGLRFVVLPGRGMDIAYAEFRGIPLSFISKTGIVSAVHYDEPDFLRSFTGGLLTTCGLTYMGAPCVDAGQTLGAHGRVANIPAQDVGIVQEWEQDDFVISVRGKVRESAVFGDNVVMTRTITTQLGSNRIVIHNVIENEGFEPAPLMVLYHMNFGFPLVSADTVLETNCQNLRARDPEAQAGLADTTTFSEPVHGYKEQVFYRDAADKSYAVLRNQRLGLGLKLEFSGKELPYLVEWKQMGEQDYVVGLEPAMWYPEGRAAARQQNALTMLQPGERREHTICVSVLE